MDNLRLKNYWLRGPISVGDEFYITAIPKDRSALYFLVLHNGEIASRETGAMSKNAETPFLIFDPRGVNELGGIAAKAKLTSISPGLDTQIQFTNSSKTAPKSLSLKSGVINKNDEIKRQIASLSTIPETFKLKEKTGLSVPGVRTEGLYDLTTTVDEFLTKVAWSRFLPVYSKENKIVDIQKNSKGIPYVLNDNSNSIDPSNLLFISLIPAKIFNEKGENTGDFASIFRKVKAYLEYANGQGTRPENYFSNKKEASVGAWYELCYDGKTCGTCYGFCPNGSNCKISYDKNNKKIAYACALAKRKKKTYWYQNPWILIILGVVVVVVIIIILMLIFKQTEGSREQKLEVQRSLAKP